MDAALAATGHAVELYAGGPAAQRSYGLESLARVDMAVAYLLMRRLDGVADSLAPVLAIPAGLRIAQPADRLADVQVRFAGPEFSVAREAKALLASQIDDFAAETLMQGSTPPAVPGSPSRPPVSTAAYLARSWLPLRGAAPSAAWQTRARRWLAPRG